MLERLHSDDRGVGLVMALSIAFIVFALGAVWITLSGHELDETQYTEHRTSALNAAEAGIRWSMAALAQDTEASGWLAVDAAAGTSTDISLIGVRSALDTADYVISGVSGSALGGSCVSEVHRLTATGRQTGEWWVRIVPLDLAEFEYQIESWGWAPNVNARQAASQKIVTSVKLIPEFDGFNNALFAEGQLSGLNRKEIYGDVYAGETASLSNYTKILPNDAGFPGDGRLRVFGDLLIASGSSNEFAGIVDVQGVVQDNKAGTDYTDLRVRNDESVDTSADYGGRSWIRDGYVSGEAKFDSKWGGTGYDGVITGTVVSPVNDLPPVPQVGLPVFTWDPTDYPGYTVYEHASAADFQTWFDANRAALHGVHHVPEATDIDFRKGSTELVDDFMVVVDGSSTVYGTPKVAAAADTPVNIAVVQTDPAGQLATANDVHGSDNVIRHLLFSAGEYNAANQTVVYGSVYGQDDVSTNRLEIHFREPDESLVSGFDFLVPDALWFTPEPIVWRAVAAGDPTPLSDYCVMP